MDEDTCMVDIAKFFLSSLLMSLVENVLLSYWY